MRLTVRRRNQGDCIHQSHGCPTDHAAVPRGDVKSTCGAFYGFGGSGIGSVDPTSTILGLASPASLTGNLGMSIEGERGGRKRPSDKAGSLRLVMDKGGSGNAAAMLVELLLGQWNWNLSRSTDVVPLPLKI